MEDKLFYPRKLYAALKDRGLASGKMWMFREEKKGALVFRKNPNGWRRVTDKDIEGIIKAYSPGGKGKWSYREKEE